MRSGIRHKALVGAALLVVIAGSLFATLTTEAESQATLTSVSIDSDNPTSSGTNGIFDFNEDYTLMVDTNSPDGEQELEEILPEQAWKPALRTRTSRFNKVAEQAAAAAQAEATQTTTDLTDVVTQLNNAFAYHAGAISAQEG